MQWSESGLSIILFYAMGHISPDFALQLVLNN